MKINYPTTQVLHETNEVLLEWYGPRKYDGSSERKVSLYISNNGHIDYIKVWGPDMKLEMEDGTVTEKCTLKNLWDWLYER